MEFLEFCQAIREAFDNSNKDQTTPKSNIISFFLDEIEKLQSNKHTDNSINMTRASILFEGFYRYLENDVLKQVLNLIRAKRWKEHFGVPTITFLLTYKNQIELTKKLFADFNLSSEHEALPWSFEKSDDALDNINRVYINPLSISQVPMPSTREVTGFFTKTHNPFGGFTTTPCDPISQQFLEHAALAAQHGGKVLEIGAAFGAATLEAVVRGATVYCNDIDVDNLAVVCERYRLLIDDKNYSMSGDMNKLVLVPGALPEELIGLPQNCFDAILICRVLHFFTGSKIQESLALLSKLLLPGGKIYVVCETPYLRNWQRFIPEFDRRNESGIEWPGEINNPVEFESSGRAASLPKFVHWITKDVLERTLARTGLQIEQSIYINRAGQFPEDLLLHGKESVGAVGIKL